MDTTTTVDKTKNLFQEVKLGDYTLRNRIIMSAMTRGRTGPKGIPSEINAEYYQQRADCGLIISECTYVDFRGHGNIGGPGLVNQEQVDGWKKVTKAVHEKGGLIFCQLYHAGRCTHTDVTGQSTLAASALKVDNGQKFWNGKERIEHMVPDEMTLDNIKEVTEQFVNSMKLAKEAGFDGVEIHSANGYIFDTFLKDWTNKRNDKYGGSIENRCRFTLEVVDKAIEIWGSGKVGIKVTPVGRFNDMYDSDPVSLYNHLCKELTQRKIAYISFFEYDERMEVPKGKGFDQILSCAKQFRPVVGTVLMSTGAGVNYEEATRRVQEQIADVVCFGKPYISNPDLVSRLKNGWPLAEADITKFYAGDHIGYTSYPIYDPNTNSNGEGK